MTFWNRASMVRRGDKLVEIRSIGVTIGPLDLIVWLGDWSLRPTWAAYGYAICGSVFVVGFWLWLDRGLRMNRQ